MFLAKAEPMVKFNKCLCFFGSCVLLLFLISVRVLNFFSPHHNLYSYLNLPLVFDFCHLQLFSEYRTRRIFISRNFVYFYCIPNNDFERKKMRKRTIEKNTINFDKNNVQTKTKDKNIDVNAKINSIFASGKI